MRRVLAVLAVLIAANAPAAIAASDATPSLAEYITSLCAASFRTAPPAEAPFLAENGAAMARMMAGMEIKPSGDIDRDFVAMMVPHHQAAMDMAQAELRYGRNEQLRRLAQEIVVEQQQQIAAMRFATAQPLPPAAPAPDQVAAPSARQEQ
jgi:uncharacterized protein (DUF305 family)